MNISLQPRLGQARHRWALLLCLSLSTPLYAQAPTPPPAPVNVANATAQQLAPQLWSPGSVVSRNDARIAAEQEGRVVTLAEIGDQVPAGGVLARFDDSLLTLAVQQARAELGRIGARLDYARAQEKRMAQLVEQATISSAQAEEAAAERRMLEQELRGAEVAVKQAEHRLNRTVIRAPFAGTVVERLIAVGEYLGTGTALVRLVDTRELEVQARAPVQLAALVKAGDEVSIRAGEQMLRQRVRAVVPVGDATSRQFELRVSLLDSDLPIGAALEVGLPSAAPRQVVTVPRDAVILRPGERYVVRVAEGDIAERVAVTTGQVIDDRIEVNGAINAGDRLVVRGAERVQPGQKLSIAAGMDGVAESWVAGSR